ncbi:MAG: hypothetical protein EOP34_10205 [Rickettsiales bacterium]|nr:MAG: hypothetical protein EOP34_10205 [Rickettsiales bacterium]
MTTIPELFKIISNDIQATFEELMKLTLRKSLRPTLNPYIQNVKVLYNPATGKYERGYVGSSGDDNVNKYNYSLTNECLGWVDDNITAFKVSARIIKSNFPARKPQLSGSYYSKLTKVKVAYNNREQKAGLVLAKLANCKKYSSLIELLFARNMQNLISNQKAGACFVCDISYIDSFRDLESVGQDIINQTSPVIPAIVASQLSTSMLRAKLFNLDNHFLLLSTSYPDIYTAYINMILAINSIQRTNMTFIINLVALLSYQSWNEFSPADQALHFVCTRIYCN